MFPGPGRLRVFLDRSLLDRDRLVQTAQHRQQARLPAKQLGRPPLEQARGHVRRSGRGDGDAVRELEQVADVDRRADLSVVLSGGEESVAGVGQ